MYKIRKALMFILHKLLYLIGARNCECSYLYLDTINIPIKKMIFNYKYFDMKMLLTKTDREIQTAIDRADLGYHFDGYSNDDWLHLIQDIKESDGKLAEPIKVLDGPAHEVLDGHHRLKVLSYVYGMDHEVKAKVFRNAY